MRFRATLALLLLLPSAASAQDLGTAVSAVVRTSGTKDGTTVRGSGFVVGLERDKATIVTASHVIEGVQQLEVTFGVDLTQSFPAGRILGIDTGNPRGLAVFQVSGVLPAGLTALSFDTETQLKRGEDAVSIVGFPNKSPIPLILRRTFASPNGNLLELDQRVGEDCSGAPVLWKGKVLGVMMEDPTEMLSGAVKAIVACDALSGWGIKLCEQSSTPETITRQPLKTPASLQRAEIMARDCHPGEELTENGITWVRICPGTFTMGSADNDQEADNIEKPAHPVTLSEFWIGKTELTNKKYRSFQPKHQGEDDLPATNVSWNDARAACDFFGGRLPTEAEWEYAARAGNKTTWSFGDDERLLSGYAWYNDGKLHPVATKKPNNWGLYDMHGNAWEWVTDWYGVYTSAPQTNPVGPATGTYRVLRGGSHDYPPRLLRSAYRNYYLSSDLNRDIGFRCARDSRSQP